MKVARWGTAGALVKRIYGHLGEVRRRSEVVEYRVEQHEERLRDRLMYGLRLDYCDSITAIIPNFECEGKLSAF